jgi:hypothetical protein
MRVTARNALVLAVIALAIGPVCLVVFGDGHAAARRSSPPVTAPAPATANAEVPVDAGCVDRPLSYGLTNDQARGEAYDRSLLDPFAFHPPLPKAGYYPPGHAPDQATLIHALYHGYVVVRYRPALPGVVKRKLYEAVKRAAQPVVVVAGRGMPFAVGALVYGRESICGNLNRTTIGQLIWWVESARPQPPRR